MSMMGAFLFLGFFFGLCQQYQHVALVHSLHLHNNFCVQRLEVMLLQVGNDILLWYLCNTTLSPKSLNVWIIPSIHNSSKSTTIVYYYIKIWVTVVQHSRFASRRLQHKHFVLLDQFLNKVSDLPQAYSVKGICSVCQ